MSNYLITDTLMGDIADAIRTKTGGSSPIQGSDFPAAISNIPETLRLTYANYTRAQAPGTHNIIIRDWDFDGEPLPGAVCALPSVRPNSGVDAVNRRIRNFTINGSIPKYAFNWSQILDIDTSLPAGVTSIEDYAFQKAYVTGSQYGGVFDDEGNQILPNPITSLPSTLTTIGTSAFASCSALALSSLPQGLISIGAEAFNSCYNVTFTSIPNTVTTVGAGAFSGCSNITEMKLSRGMTKMLTGMFSGCSRMRKLFIPIEIIASDSYIVTSCSNLTDIYCEASAKPDGWNSSWNSRTNTTTTVHWGATEAQYDAA